MTVVNPGPGGGTSNVVFFEVTLPTSAAAFGRSALGPFLSPLGMVTVDFNRDGKLDLVVANSASNTISVSLGNGNGTFRGHVDYATGNGPASVAVGDFNGDGKLDLVVGGDFAGIDILLGNGDGTFQTAANYSVPCCAFSLAVGDFNEDGKLDLVAVINNDRAVSVLLGNGDGTFQPALNYPAGLNPATVAVGDFNRDGHLDLAVANGAATNASPNISVLLGNGDGTFQAALDYPVGNGPQTVVAGGFNGDGILDLAVTNAEDNTVSVLLGNGNGTFRSAVDYSTGTYPWALTLGDFNGDGKLDLAVASGVTQILFGNGDGTFQPAADLTAPEQSNPNSVAAGDFTGQGRLDLLVAFTATSSVSELVQSMLAPSATNVTFPLQVLKTNSAPQKVRSPT